MSWIHYHHHHQTVTVLNHPHRGQNFCIQRTNTSFTCTPLTVTTIGSVCFTPCLYLQPLKSTARAQQNPKLINWHWLYQMTQTSNICGFQTIFHNTTRGKQCAKCYNWQWKQWVRKNKNKEGTFKTVWSPHMIWHRSQMRTSQHCSSWLWISWHTQSTLTICLCLPWPPPVVMHFASLCAHVSE